MRLASWNVNGLRACHRNGFLDWLKRADAHVVCLQEIKVAPEQLEDSLKNPVGYEAYWNPAQKPGYSGTAIYSKLTPSRVHYGLSRPEFDDEGRVLILEFSDFVLINAYFPNSQRDAARLPYKLRFCEALKERCDGYRSQGLSPIICGDFNIAHREIDLKNPKSNVGNAGFLPEERSWMDQFLGGGYVDTFRKFYPNDRDRYTWWSYRPGVREKNIGWRLDYFVVAEELAGKLKSVAIEDQVKGSDHCPVTVTLV